MLKRDEWLSFTRELDWQLSYVREEDAFPEVLSGKPWLPGTTWQNWEEPFRTSFTEYVHNQHDKNAALHAVRDAVGRIDDLRKLPEPWINAVKLHAATLPLAEFAAVVGHLRGARFGRQAAWRNASTLGALDELRHAQIPLMAMHELVRFDAQFDWTHKFFHTNNWVAIAARHLLDELLLSSNAIEFAIGTNFVLETGFTNLQFIGVTQLAHNVGDRLFEKMLASIQTDEARHAQIGRAVLEEVVRHDRSYAQHLCDKWFWRSWLYFSVVTGISIDYLTPLEQRTRSFKEFTQEWVIDQYLRTLGELGLERPWYWETFLSSVDYYHHMVYASAYSYRASVWFDMVLPGPQDREWLRTKYPDSFPQIDPMWQRITERWRATDPGNDLGVHGTAIIGFCSLCQLVLCGGTPAHNSAVVIKRDGKKFIFCSEPCRSIFEAEPSRYQDHKDVVARVLAGEAPGNLMALVRQYFGLTYETWGKDVMGGVYPFINRRDK